MSATTNWIWSLIACGVMIFAGFAAIMVVNEKDRAERETTFRQQCVNAGYTADKCRFFEALSATPGGAVAIQTLLQPVAPAHRPTHDEAP
jgi:hypothetical protein